MSDHTTPTPSPRFTEPPLSVPPAPPQPLPQSLQGDRWQFAALPAADIWQVLHNRPVPVSHMPLELNPLTLGLASTTWVPGLIWQGGRRSLPFVRWLQQQQPDHLHVFTEEVQGVVLHTGLKERWILATFEDPTVKTAGQIFNDRCQRSQGLHFLLVQPDDSGMTFTGVWLLRHEG